jgi:hypothetical protein
MRYRRVPERQLGPGQVGGARQVGVVFSAHNLGPLKRVG